MYAPGEGYAGAIGKAGAGAGAGANDPQISCVPMHPKRKRF